ncbi:MAG: glutamine-hydrolyzing carbamoyl-phosphate synthase small subunit [Acidobacteria bacterium]|nr:glutamine-hydrolyzing carbamoyl-phosphate synthase small subunit [Acidobacteriota bacterium]MBV9476128.1 glutamine-hydrolyzing carbamoyl-phosphate synthase small subunit [Acidobacteriota bacterium]
MTRARLVLEDGTVYEGESFGATADAIGEVVFNTSLTGYQEIATDPSYRFQIVVMTYPHIGNYGVEDLVRQSDAPQVAGFVVRDAVEEPSNARAEMSLGDYFARTRISAISGIDTRALTRRIRNEGAMRGMITTDVTRSVDAIVGELRQSPSMAGLDLVQRVTALRPYPFEEEPHERKLNVAVYDFGVKRDILRQLVRQGCNVTVYPATTHADEILARDYDGVLLSNGPGDPEPVTYAHENIRQLVGKLPVFGICLGHQLLGIALGGRTYKLKFGHRGGNHPVKDLRSGRVEITAQNHGFSVDPDSLSENDVEYTHINLNDQTLEGFRHRREPVVAVQYHPESAPGPHDSFYLFDDFVAMMKEWKKE